MGAVLVKKNLEAEPVLELVALSATEGVEFSVSSSSKSLCVLVPVTDPKLAQQFLQLWLSQKSESQVNPLPVTPRFVRCDFELGNWIRLSVYGDEQGQFKNSSTNLSVFISRYRYSKEENGVVTRYLDVRYFPNGQLRDMLIRELHYSNQSMIELTNKLFDQYSALGWVQLLVMDEKRKSLKLDIYTTKLQEVIRTSKQYVRYPAVLAYWMNLARHRIGYVGITISEKGVDFRYYGQAFRCPYIKNIIKGFHDTISKDSC